MDQKVDRVDQKIDSVREDLKGPESRLTKRIDKIGQQVASLEDDTPTREEIDNLDGRVKKLEQMTAKVRSFALLFFGKPNITQINLAVLFTAST